MSELIRCARAIAGGALRKDFAFAVRDGAIVGAGDYESVKAQHRDLQTRAFPEDRLIVPGFVNGHSHAYQILLRGWADDLSFERWRRDALYRVIPKLEPEDVYWVFVAAFSEMLAAGITTVAEFFYLNGYGNAYAEAAIRAAADTGIRLLFARTWMDLPQVPSAFRESVAQARERTLALRTRFPDLPLCIAPHSLHAASEEMLCSAAEFAREQDCDLHIHVAETQSEVTLSQKFFGTTPVIALDRLGVVNERTVVIHAIHVSEEEKTLLAQRRARLVSNPATNGYLGDGVTDVAGMRARGVVAGLGTDANVKPSLIDEMRMLCYLQKSAQLDAAAFDAATAFALGTREGGHALGLPVGDLAAGMRADFLALNARAIDPWSPPLQALVYRGADAWVQSAFVGGRRVFTGEPGPLALEAREAVTRVAARCV